MNMTDSKITTEKEDQAKHFLEAVKRDGTSLGKVPKKFKTPELCHAAIQQTIRASS